MRPEDAIILYDTYPTSVAVLSLRDKNLLGKSVFSNRIRTATHLLFPRDAMLVET